MLSRLVRRGILAMNKKALEEAKVIVEDYLHEGFNKTRREVLSELNREASVVAPSARAVMAYHKEKTKMSKAKSCGKCSKICTQNYDYFKNFNNKGGLCRKCYFDSL